MASGPDPPAIAERAALVRRAYEVWATTADVDAMLEFVAPEIEWITPPHAPEPGPYRGREQVRRAFRGYLDSFDVFRTEIERILPARPPDDLLVLALTRVRGKGSGAEVTIPVAHVIRVRDGLIVRFQVLVDRERALREFAAG